jgi:chromate transporter
VPRIRRRPLLGVLLDGVNVAAVGLMAAVVLLLARDAVVDWYTLLLALIAEALLLRTHLNSAWLVVGGGALGIAYQVALAR